MVDPKEIAEMEAPEETVYEVMDSGFVTEIHEEQLEFDFQGDGRGNFNGGEGVNDISH